MHYFDCGRKYYLKCVDHLYRSYTMAILIEDKTIHFTLVVVVAFVEPVQYLLLMLCCVAQQCYYITAGSLLSIWNILQVISIDCIMTYIKIWFIFCKMDSHVFPLCYEHAHTHKHTHTHTDTNQWYVISMFEYQTFEPDNKTIIKTTNPKMSLASHIQRYNNNNR